MRLRDQNIITIANRAHGVVTRKQLLEVGLSASAIARRLDNGTITQAAKRVYVIESLMNDLTPLAVGLATQPDAVASHFTAARLWHLKIHRRWHTDQPEILVPRQHRRRIPGVLVRSTRHLPNSHRTEVSGIRVTTAERTLADTTYRLGSIKAARYVTQRALADQVADPGVLISTHLQLARRGRAGTVFTRSLYDELLGRDGYPASELEIRTLRMLQDHGIGGFVCQFQPSWYEGADGIVDFADPLARLVLESDGRQWHAIDQAQRDDRRRDRIAQREGWRVIRFTWADVVHDAEALCADIRQIRRQQSIPTAA